MNIVAIGTNLKLYEKQFITHMFKSTLDCTDETIKILDAVSNKIKTTDKEVVATFGKRAKDLFTSSKEKYKVHISLPEPKLLQLQESGENDKYRTAAYEQLMQLKNIDTQPQDSIQVITEDSLPVIDTKEILSTLSKTGTKVWQGINREGKKIRLTLEPSSDDTVDVNLTFAELFALETAMETLQVKEFQIVTSSKPSKE